MYSPTSSEPSSPTNMRQTHKTAIPSGFRPSPRKRTPIAQMSVRELEDLHQANLRLLAKPRQSTSADGQSWMARVTAEQAAIEERLVELVGMESINVSLKRTKLKGDDDMDVEPDAEPYTNPMLEAKRKALSQFAPAHNGTAIGSLGMQEAIELEQRAHRADKERQERLLEKRRRQGMHVPGEDLTRKQMEARMWAFMSHKPTDSDLEDDSEEEYDDDPASWFDDEEEDGRKGQLIVEPDEEDYTDVIRVDSTKINHYNPFYEPHD